MAKVTLSGYIVVENEDLAAVKQALAEHKRLTHAESGCLVFDVTPTPGNPNRFDVYEEFVDRNAFEQHQARVKASAWGKITANVARHYQISND
ncbi:antibiotic biosynthesis monooxygenase [Vibrio sp. CDRSL-10 TSBA]